jgi:integrase
LEPLPADPATVALYLTDAAERLKPATLTRRAAAISVRHGEAGLPSPTRDPRVRTILSGIRRTHGTAQRKATPATIGDIRRMVAHLPNTVSGARDAALLLVGFAGALRRSELTAINWGDIRTRDEGLEILVRHSKTDQEGRGRRVAIPYGSDEQTCPVRSLERWREHLSATRGAVFRSVNRHGGIGTARLSDTAVNGIVKRAAATAGLDPSVYSGHSLRAGFATTAALNGASERQIANQTGHRSMETLRDYIRPAQLFTDNAVGTLGL